MPSKVPRYWQRKPDHDYRSRCFYMVTMRKAPQMPYFSRVSAPAGDYAHPSVSHSRLGTIISNELHNFGHFYPGVEIYDYVVMPDHVHFVIYVSVAGIYNLGSLVAALKAACSKGWRDSLGLDPSQTAAPVFLPGFHDRICRNFDHINTVKRYVRDNPRRLMLKRLYPEYYRERRRISIDGTIYVMIGNPFLILHPFITQALYSSRRSPDDNRRAYEQCLANIRRGGVAIGTFIAHPEKELRDKAIELGCSIILMHGNGFDNLYAPPQPYFDLCREGRCLIIGEERCRAATAADLRDHNRALNALAERIAAGIAILRKAG